MKALRFLPKFVSSEAFYRLRRSLGLSRSEVSAVLSVSVRTVQNWETGGARVPWMAFKLLKLIRGYELPGASWEGWSVRGEVLFSPDDRPFPVADLYYLQNTFAQAKLFRELYARQGVSPSPANVLPFPDLRLLAEVLPDERRPRTLSVLQGGDPLSADLRPVRTGGRS